MRVADVQITANGDDQQAQDLAINERKHIGQVQDRNGIPGPRCRGVRFGRQLRARFHVSSNRFRSDGDYITPAQAGDQAFRAKAPIIGPMTANPSVSSASCLSPARVKHFETPGMGI